MKNDDDFQWIRPLKLFEEKKIVKICAPMVRYSKYVLPCDHLQVIMSDIAQEHMTNLTGLRLLMFIINIIWCGVLDTTKGPVGLMS